MSESVWNALITALGRAGLDYTSLHRVVTAIFVSRGCGPDSELLADVTLDRVGKKIYKGEEVRSFVAYSREVANLVWKEYCREREKFRKTVRDLAYLHTDVQTLEGKTDLRRQCQEACVNGLTASERRLLVNYYIVVKDPVALAVELGIVIETLRTRIHRLKK